MEKLTTTQIAMLIATVRGEGGWKKLATKGAGIKQLGNLLTEKHGEEKANAAMEALDSADWTEAQAIVAGLTGADALATKGENLPTEGLDGDKTEEITPAAEPVKGKRKAAKAKTVKPSKPKGEGRGSRGNRDKVITIVEGKDPFRKGTQSGDTWELIKANPGLSFQAYLDKGARANTILFAIRNGWVTLS